MSLVYLVAPLPVPLDAESVRFTIGEQNIPLICLYGARVADEALGLMLIILDHTYYRYHDPRLLEDLFCCA